MSPAEEVSLFLGKMFVDDFFRMKANDETSQDLIPSSANYGPAQTPGWPPNRRQMPPKNSLIITICVIRNIFLRRAMNASTTRYPTTSTPATRPSILKTPPYSARCPPSTHKVGVETENSNTEKDPKK